MKSTIILFLLLTAVSFVTAQSSIGLHFGAGGYHSLEKDLHEPEKKLSFSIGLDYHVKLKKNFSFYTSIGALRIRDELTDGGFFSNGTGSPVFVEIQFQRLVIFYSTQVGIKYYKTYNKFHFFVQPYIETDIFIFKKNSTTITGRIGESTVSTSILESKSLFYTLGLGFGLGVERDLGEKFSIYFMPDIKLLFTDIYISTERKSIISAIKLGLLYKL